VDHFPTDGNARDDAALKNMRRPFSAFLILLSASAACCYGDGGAVITRQTIDGLQLTVFASPAPLRAGPVDVSVLVQKGEKPVLDAAVDISWKANSAFPVDWLPPCCTMESGTERIPALRGHSNNRFLYSAIVPMKTAGPSELRVRVLEAGREVVLSCDFDVRRPLPPLLAFWPWLAFPPVAIAGFLLHQKLSRTSPRNGPRSPGTRSSE
jgi:hypothetical protein